MKSNKLVPLIILLVVSLAAFWLVQNFRIVETEISTGYDGEPRTNTYYAARQFLRRMGYDARTLTTIDLHNQAYDDQSTLLYLGSRLNLGEQRSQQLLDWVNRGGHLIIKPEYVREVDYVPQSAPFDLILDEIGITAFKFEFKLEEGYGYDENDVEPWTTIDYLDDSEADEVEMDDAIDLSELTIGKHTAAIEFYLSNYLTGTIPGDETASDAQGIQWLSRPLDDGHLSVMTDFSPFLNYRIDMHQHAQLLRLVAGKHANQQSIIWLLHDTDMPPLWKLILNSAFPVVVTCTAILLLWLWGSLFRFGPIVREPEPEQRQLLEHLDAAGNHQYKYAPTKLFSSTQTALHQRILRLYPQWPDLNYQHKSELLLKQLNLTEAGARLVLSKPTTLAPNEFYAAIKMLHTIRKSL